MDFQTDTMSTAASVEDLLDLEEDHEADEQEDTILRDLELQMQVESLYYSSQSSEELEMEAQTPSPIRSLIQFPGDSSGSTVWVKTKTGRFAKIILEAEDEEENVGLLEFEDSSQEIRRLDSYATKSKGTIRLPATPELRRVDTLTVPGIGGARLPSMRAGKNPFYSPQEAGLFEEDFLGIPHHPSYRAGKNPTFNPAVAEFF